MVTVAAVTVVVTSLLTVFFVADTVEGEARADFKRQAEQTGRLVEAELAALPDDRATARADFVTAARILEVARRIGGHDYVEAAFIPAAERFAALGDNVLISALPAEVLTTPGDHSYTVQVEGGSVFAVTRMLPVARGHLVIAIGSRQDLVPWRQILLRVGLTLLISVVLASLLAWWLSRSLTKRTARLAGAAIALAGGDLTARVDDAGRDEVADVAGAFNEMAARLQAGQARERDFLMSVSHDLRTPLTTISGYAEGLSEGSIPEGDVRRVGSVLHAQAGRLSRLIEDLMLLSRLEARQFVLRPEPVGLAAHIREVIDGFTARAEASRVALRASLADVGTVHADPDRIAQLVSNLMENSLRYTPEGGTITVALTSTPGPAVAIEVADTGPGIDPEDLPHVFERLYVAQRYRPVRPQGSGLGLSIVKELVDAMGGVVAVDSQPGQGTRVQVQLPVDR